MKTDQSPEGNPRLGGNGTPERLKRMNAMQACPLEAHTLQLKAKALEKQSKCHRKPEYGGKPFKKNKQIKKLNPTNYSQKPNKYKPIN